jgi:hypothetical protein
MHSFAGAKMKDREATFIKHFGDDVHHYSDLLAEAFDGVITEGVSKYPVFIFHQNEVTMGIQIADRTKTAGNWNVNISTLEEFYIKGMVTIEQVNDIKVKITGTPPQYCCLVLLGKKANLVFFPRTQT